MSKYYVISAMDKSKADLAFTCPLLYQHKMLKMHIGGKNINTYYEKEKVKHSFLEMEVQLSYSGLSMPLRTHEFGAADVIPKESNLIEKSRPLGSYFRHAGRYGLSACCKCQNLDLCGIMDGHPSNITVASVTAMHDRCFQFYLDVENK